DLTVAYANLAHLAQAHSNKPAYWQQGRRLQTEAAPTNRVATLSAASAWLTLDSLLGVARPGDEGYWDKFSSSRKVAWKTGTSYGQRDAWAIGTTPEYTVGVWVGNANGEGRAGLTGTQSAAPILFNTFNFLPPSKGWFQRPDAQLTDINICRDDGYLSNGFCATKTVKVPTSSHFARITPYHQRIYLDATQQWRVNSDCESVATMQTRDWFVLPPDQAHYYQQYHADYQPLPAWRADCVAELTNQVEALTVVYPQEGTQVYLPRELDGKLGELVFRAVPTQPEALLYWHLDNQFLGTTQYFHQLAAQPTAGKHRLAVVDEAGNRIERSFEVLVHEAKSQ
ncbi:MAG: penicillin-binding protein 1C, partial [Thiothrix sp.]